MIRTFVGAAGGFALPPPTGRSNAPISAIVPGKLPEGDELAIMLDPYNMRSSPLRE